MDATALPERIASKIRVTGGCWEWIGAVKNNGYGVVWWNGRVENAHRVVYEVLVGPVPDGLDVDHDCHNQEKSCKGGWTCAHRRCVRPDHLRAATRSDNLRRGRSTRKVPA